MPKVKSRTQYVSKGQGRNVARKTLKSMRSCTSEVETANNKLNAFLRGKKVMLTVENPNKQETNKRFIRVPAKEVWGRKKKEVSDVTGEA